MRERERKRNGCTLSSFAAASESAAKQPKCFNKIKLNIIRNLNASSRFRLSFFQWANNANTFTPHLFSPCLWAFCHPSSFDWLNLFKMSPIYNWMRVREHTIRVFIVSFVYRTQIVRAVKLESASLANRFDSIPFRVGSKRAKKKIHATEWQNSELVNLWKSGARILRGNDN